MLAFIRDRTAAPYFSNLVWFIGSHIIELDTCVRNDADHQSQNRLSDLVAEHLDHLHYLNDILSLNIADLNKVLSEHLLHKLLVPLYVYSLTKSATPVGQSPGERKHVSVVVSLFLLSQVFLIVSHEPLVRTLAAVILKSDSSMVEDGATRVLEYQLSSFDKSLVFAPPSETLEKSLEILSGHPEAPGSLLEDIPEQEADVSGSSDPGDLRDPDNPGPSEDIKHLNVTDEEKEQRLALEGDSPSQSKPPLEEPSISPTVAKPFLETILNSLHCTENDYATLFAVSLLYALISNEGIDKETLDFATSAKASNNWYQSALLDKLIHIISMSCQTNAKIRLVTLEMSIKLLIKIVISDGESLLCDAHLAAIESAKEESTALLRNFYKSEDIFLDMFEDECSEVQKKPLNVEWLMMDSNILLPPTGTPMTGIEFSKRLPCGEVERARRAIRVFFLVRELSMLLSKEPEGQLPLTNPGNCVQVGNVLDLNNSDLIACTVVWKDGQKIRRFLVIDVIQLILVEPDTRKLGWGVAKLVGFLQDIEVAGDKDDSRCLHLTIHKPLSSSASNRLPLLSAKFIFDDHIRCMAAKQRLTKGRIKARQKKMGQIAKLLDIPTNLPSCSTPPNYPLLGMRHERTSGRGQRPKDQRGMFTVNKVPGFAAQLRRQNEPRTGVGRRADLSPSGRSGDSGIRPRDSSPKMPRPRSEEIPLEDMRLRKSSLTGNGSSGLQLVNSIEPDTASLSSSVATDVSITKKCSEETSFTSPQTTDVPLKPRRKGQVETV